MNYSLLQSKYFLIFIAISAMAFAAIPMVKSTFASSSDAYMKSQLNRVQAELFFIDQGRGSFKNACYTGSVGILIQDLIQEYGKKVVCRTNLDHSKMLVYIELRSGVFYCIDSVGISCELISEPQTGFRCKDF